MTDERTWPWAALALSAVLLALAPRARAADQVEPEAFARVVVDSADLRTGPGVSYRVLYTSHRGETFALDGRPGYTEIRPAVGPYWKSASRIWPGEFPIAARWSR